MFLRLAAIEKITCDQGSLAEMWGSNPKHHAGRSSRYICAQNADSKTGRAMTTVPGVACRTGAIFFVFSSAWRRGGGERGALVMRGGLDVKKNRACL